MFVFFFSSKEMPHSYGHADTQQLSVGDELYNLTQLAEVSIVYFKHHTTTTIVDDTEKFEKASELLSRPLVGLL